MRLPHPRSAIYVFFYRTVYTVAVSDYLSVTNSSTKTAKRRITQTTRHDNPGTLVFSERELTCTLVCLCVTLVHQVVVVFGNISTAFGTLAMR